MDYGPANDRILPVMIREGVSVAVYGLPLDLTQKEAEKVAAIIMAHATPSPSCLPAPAAT